ncbi:major facilitator superfamily domain-containing protein [Xylaria bambusicola]|uniref:major facilitator superfamily domain-containing protein n=1 Tax=Xylaria bambusicola TaxID=326684 RepID=UPI0020081225|nr:major facilitator superfamily domain-containing protein [Xylaria bambusicola]KAI0520680.1 major facilitator superfamily domain-containing protein [Xylaria bambusicola]
MIATQISDISEPPVPHSSVSADLSANQAGESLAVPLNETGTPSTRTKLRLYGILASLYLALFLAALDTTVVAQSIPTICNELHSAAGYVWIGGAYLLANAATGPIWSKFSDIWGRKPIFLAAIALFIGASILAALSKAIFELLIARTVQGVAAGGMIILSVTIISDIFSVRERSFYLGLTGFVWAIAGSAGPLIGGAFTEFVSWRWCFWINLPICGITFGLALLLLDVNNPRTNLVEGLKAVDWLGTVLILAVTILTLVGLNFGGSAFPWNSSTVITLIVVGGATTGLFLFVEHRLAKYPLIPLGVFKSISNNATFIIVFSHGAVLVGTDYYMPLYLQSVQQASPIRSGVLMLPLIIVTAVVEILSGWAIERTGRYIEFLWAGSIFMTLGAGLFILLGADTTTAMVVGLEIISALGRAMLFQAPVAAIQSGVSQEDTAAATATLLFLRSIGMSLSIVIGGVVFQNSMNARHSTLVMAGLDESVLEALSGSNAAANVYITRTIQDTSQRRVIIEAFAWSVKNMFILYTAFSATTVVASVFVKHNNLATEHKETKTGLGHLKMSERSE